MSLENTVEIIPFTTALKEPVKTLNIEWLKKLLPAVHLYEKFDFIEISLEEGIYERADIKMVRTID